MILPDVLEPGLRIVFCGTAAGKKSAERKAYAGPGNMFYPTLDEEIGKADYDIRSFEEKIFLYQPQLVCFNGKNAAAVYLQLKSTAHVRYGIHSKQIGQTKIFVAPSTSRAAQKYWDESIWKQLQEFI